MHYPIDNLELNGVTYRGQMLKIAFDAGRGLWTGTALWRGGNTFKKGAVTGEDLNALTTAAIQLIAPPA